MSKLQCLLLSFHSGFVSYSNQIGLIWLWKFFPFWFWLWFWNRLWLWLWFWKFKFFILTLTLTLKISIFYFDFDFDFDFFFAFWLSKFQWNWNGILIFKRLKWLLLHQVNIKCRFFYGFSTVKHRLWFKKSTFFLKKEDFEKQDYKEATRRSRARFFAPNSFIYGIIFHFAI